MTRISQSYLYICRIINNLIFNEMTEKQQLISIRGQLPHGAIAEIARRAGVLIPTASRALSGDTRSPKLPEITKAAAEYLTEYKAKQREATRALNDLMNS